MKTILTETILCELITNDYSSSSSSSSASSASAHASHKNLSLRISSAAFSSHASQETSLVTPSCSAVIGTVKLLVNLISYWSILKAIIKIQTTSASSLLGAALYHISLVLSIKRVFKAKFFGNIKRGVRRDSLFEFLVVPLSCKISYNFSCSC